MCHPLGINFGSLLFLIFVDDLCNGSNILEPIMFADDSKLFSSHQNVNALSRKFNEELKNVGDWFKLNKLSLNNRKTKYTLFHKKSSKDDLPLKLPALKVADNKIEIKK